MSAPHGQPASCSLAAHLCFVWLFFSSQALSELQSRFDSQSTQLKAAESLAAASKSRIAALENRLMEIASKPLLAEISDRPPNEWSGAAVVYWVEHVFGREHKTAQITEFVNELRTRIQSAAPNGSGSGSGGSGSESGLEVVTGQVLLSLTRINQFKALKLVHMESIEALDASIERLRQRTAKSHPSDSDFSSATVVLPP